MVLTLRELLEAALAHLELQAREPHDAMLSEEEQEAIVAALAKATQPPEHLD